MKDRMEERLLDPREARLLERYIYKELEGIFARLERESEAYALAAASLEKKLARLEELDSRLAHSLRESLAELRRLDWCRSFWAGYAQGGDAAH